MRSRAHAVQRVVIAILLLNLLVAGAKVGYGAVSGSLAVASDALHSLLDAASNVGALFVLRVAAAPPDEGHPYGHRKVEIVAAAMIGILISAASLRFAWSAIEALLEGRDAPEVSGYGLLLMAGTLVANVLVAVYEHRRGKQLESPFLVADAAHTASDVFVTIGVIVALALSRLGVWRADAIAALVIMAVIARVAWKILAANIGVLVDRAMIPAEKVRRTALAIAGVAGCHRVRTRGMDGAVHLDLHLLVDGDLPVREAHGMSHKVEDALRRAFPEIVDVTIHVEPDDEEDEGL